jgi:hypothetical protein
MPVTEEPFGIEGEYVIRDLSGASPGPPASLHVVTELMEHTPVTLLQYIVDIKSTIGKIEMGTNWITAVHIPSRDLYIWTNTLNAVAIRWLCQSML